MGFYQYQVRSWMEFTHDVLPIDLTCLDQSTQEVINIRHCSSPSSLMSF